MDRSERLAGAPISWGICEVPGWGLMLPARRVLQEMASLGIKATELGPPGFLPDEAEALKSTLDSYGLRLVAAFIPLVMHDPDQTNRTVATAKRMAQLLRAAGAEVFLSAALVDEAWAPRRPLDGAEWRRLYETLERLDDIAAEEGLRHVLHPHLGTLVETADDVQRVLGESDVGWCLDTGHLTLGGTDPLEFARTARDRVGHVHLKDVDLSVAARLRTGELDLVPAVQQGLFQPLGRGDVPIEQVVVELENGGYQGWYVLEQDTAITTDVPPEGSGPVADVQVSIEFLRPLLTRLSVA
jgi:inosose dehydratase